MNGPEHYQEAERLLEASAQQAMQRNFTVADTLRKTAAVHAQLAQVAATIVCGPVSLDTAPEDWREALT